MLKKMWITVLVLGFVILFSVQSTIAADPNWREKQKAYFEEIGLKPGDVMGKEDSKKLDGLLPPQILEWFKKGLIEIKIAEMKYDIQPDDEWMNAGKKNNGKFKIDKVKNLVDAATGKAPMWVYGVPFPDLDFKKDPDAASKFMYNRMISTFRGGSLFAPFHLEWIGRNGVERIVDCFWAQYCYWARSDGEARNPRRFRYMYITGVTKPYDLAGLNQLTYRKLDGTEDDLYVYIPAIRRVKKMSGANRSDPYVGSDVTVDDGGGFAGLTNSMEWRFIEEKVGLLCMEKRDTERTNHFKLGSDGRTWKVGVDPTAMQLGWAVEGWKGAKWAPVNSVYVPSTVVVIEGMPRDAYYNSGKAMYWVDKATYHTMYKIIWDKAGEYWKAIVFLPRCLEWGNGRKGYHAGGTAGYIVVDDKTHHATGVRLGYVELDNLDPRSFTVERLRIVSK